MKTGRRRETTSGGRSTKRAWNTGVFVGPRGSEEEVAEGTHFRRGRRRKRRSGGDEEISF